MNPRLQAKKELFYEIGAFLLCLAVLVWKMSPLLVTGITALRHDNFYNYYPAFQFLADSLLNGHLPLWNPYTHAGEPFYPILVQERLLEPITLLTIWIGHYITPDFILLCSWNRFIQSAVMVWGVYLVLRPIANYFFIRLSLIPILIFSSFFLGSFHQEGILHQFLWVPYLLFFLQRILLQGDGRWGNWIAFSLCVGINFQTYFFAGPSLFLLIYLGAIALYNRGIFSRFIAQSQLLRKIGFSSVLLVLMALPNIMLFLDSKHLVFPMRMYSQEERENQKVSGEPGPMQYEGKPADVLPAIKMPYDLVIATGSYSTVDDYLQILFPRGNATIQGSKFAWGFTSEAYLYLGLLTWIIALFGLFFGEHEHKSIWQLILGTFFLLSLGATGILHRLLYYLYPPMWGMRNCHCLVLYVQFALLYFYVLGLNRLCVHFITLARTAHSVDSEIILQKKCREVLKSAKARLLPFVGLSWLSWEIILRLSLLSLPGSLNIGPVLVAWGLALCFFRKKLKKSGVFSLLIFTHLNLLFYRVPHKIWFLNYFLGYVGLPVMALLAFELFPNLLMWGKRNAMALAGLFILWLAADLISAVGYSHPLYTGQPHPSKYLNVLTEAKTPVFPDNRAPHEFYPLANIVADPPLEQIPRYLSILFRKSYALSAQFLRRRKDMVSFSEALNLKRWNSFLELKNYFDLVHANLKPQVVEQMFAVRAPAVQFKSGALILGNQSQKEFNQLLNGPKGLAILKNNLVLNWETKRSEVALSTASNAGFQYHVIHYNPNKLNLRLFVPANGYLYWADGYDRHWKSFLDGKEVGLIRANFNFKAINISPGMHEIEFSYEPVGFMMGLLCFYGVIILGASFILATLVAKFNFPLVIPVLKQPEA